MSRHQPGLPGLTSMLTSYSAQVVTSTPQSRFGPQTAQDSAVRPTVVWTLRCFCSIEPLTLYRRAITVRRIDREGAHATHMCERLAPHRVMERWSGWRGAEDYVRLLSCACCARHVLLSTYRFRKRLTVRNALSHQLPSFAQTVARCMLWARSQGRMTITMPYN
jgi:hypothetical protein